MIHTLATPRLGVLPIRIHTSYGRCSSIMFSVDLFLCCTAAIWMYDSEDVYFQEAKAHAEAEHERMLEEKARKWQSLQSVSLFFVCETRVRPLFSSSSRNPRTLTGTLVLTCSSCLFRKGMETSGSLDTWKRKRRIFLLSTVGTLIIPLESFALLTLRTMHSLRFSFSFSLVTRQSPEPEPLFYSIGFVITVSA